MTLFSAVIIGIVEGITEFLPISSTAHMEIASRLLKFQELEFLKTFEIVIQFGAILAVVVIYFSLLKKNWLVWKKIIAAFIPTAVIGFVLYKIIKNIFLGNIMLMTVMLGVGGIVLVVFEHFAKGRELTAETKDIIPTAVQEIEKLSYKNAFIIGLAQALAVVPGVSRSAATIIAGRSLAMSQNAIVEFSFLLAIPTMAAAAGYDLLKNAGTLSMNDAGLLSVGFITAFLAAYFSVKWLLAYVKKHGFSLFGYYRIVLALVLAFYFF